MTAEDREVTTVSAESGAARAGSSAKRHDTPLRPAPKVSTMSPHEHTTSTITRGDRPSAAAGSLRAIIRQRRSYNATRATMVGLYIFLWLAIIGSVVHLVVTRSVEGVVMLWAVTLLAIAGRFVTRTQGASTLLASAAGASVTVLFLAESQSTPKLAMAVAVAAVAATLLPLRAKARRLPTTSVALLSQWGIVLVVVASRWSGPVAVYAAAAVVAVLVAVQCNLSGWIAFRKASKRSGIVTLPVSHRRDKLGLVLPPLMSQENLERGIEAERATAEVLDTLGPEYVVLHSRSVPGSNADIDHLVVGPHGVAIVDSKYRTGDMEWRQRTVKAGEKDATEAADAAVADSYKHAAADVPNEVLDTAALRARERAHEANLVVAFVEDDDTSGRFPEWYLNGAPASGTLMSSASWEAHSVEHALAVPDDGETELPCMISVYGARMSEEWGGAPLFDINGDFDRWVDVVHSRAIADRIRELPARITDPQQVTDLATIVDYLFPRK